MSELPENPHLEGVSLLPQLKDPTTVRELPAITSSYYGNHAVRTRDWRLISYEDGALELYDHRSDPEELTNLAGDPDYQKTIKELAQWVPKQGTPEFRVPSERLKKRRGAGK